MESSDIIALLMSFGILGAGLLALAEKFVPIFPSYVMLMMLGMTARDGAGLVTLVAVTSVGSLVGAVGWYGLGRSLGAQRIEAFVARFGRYVLLKPALYARLAGAYRSNHFWVTLLGQTLPTVRIYLALPAGVLALEPKAFVLATAIGTLIWNMPFLTLGYVLRGSGHDAVQVGFWVAAALIASEILIVLALRMWKRRSPTGARVVAAAPDRIG
ncbi:alkaline phosphatase [Afipia sp. P52-10]|uniref:DedA family protein n=1 Tax=Afipia sp. P52-10 TaxID=1429916 RepID=UPI0003DF25BC|nr:VTT domain-containing protein [Afipia sp. P52-10]ETR77745.1 alkaline phosphatase [Afipia sp. P52-10]